MKEALSRLAAVEVRVRWVVGLGNCKIGRLVNLQSSGSALGVSVSGLRGEKVDWRGVLSLSSWWEAMISRSLVQSRI